MALTGFAAGVMVSAAAFNLLLPSMEQSQHLGKMSYIPAVVGFWIGIGFLLLLDYAVPHIHTFRKNSEGPHTHLKRSTMLTLAVTLHNIPEGMAVGAAIAAYISGEVEMAFSGAFALAIGIALQNFPEGAVISMPLRADGLSKRRCFAYGALSGAAEPVAAFFTILFAEAVLPSLPYLLSFAAGAMLYVVVEELIPDNPNDKHKHSRTIWFALGFTLMIVLDRAIS